MVIKKFKYKKVSSTNDVAMTKIKNGFKSGIIISETQTCGRGQYGKKWISRKGNLFFSIFFTINKKIKISRLVISNLRMIKKILSTYIKSKIIIKKPNDIIVHKKKICGILNETLFYNNLKFVVVGIGININNSPNLKDYSTTYLNELTNKKVSKVKLLNKIIKAFEKKIK
tara:strand:- start:671 stop:1183 length:513 start_codon:yes stop_codon:yes gene_type:complete